MSFFYMIRQRWRIIAIVTVLVLLVVGIVLRVSLVPAGSGGGADYKSLPDSRQSANTGSGSESNPEPTPTFTDSLKGFEPDVPEIPDNDCRNYMTGIQYAAFMKRLYQFEVVSQMQPSNERLKLMKPFATETFMDTQKGFFKSPVVEAVSVKVDPDSAMACEMSSDKSVIARITPTITTVETSEDGSERVLQGPMTLSIIHFTRWVMSDGVWLVEEEKE